MATVIVTIMAIDKLLVIAVAVCPQFLSNIILISG